MSDLRQRLRACHLEYLDGQPCGLGPPINPDGPEAADELDRLLRIEHAARDLSAFVAKSVNVGPATLAPANEAALWINLRNALAAPRGGKEG